MTQELLKIENLQAWYGESHILHGVNLTVNEGEVVTILGRNGAGRTTTLRAIVGLVGTRKGVKNLVSRLKNVVFPAPFGPISA